MTVPSEVLDSFHRVLVEEIRAKRPEYLRGPFTVAEIYQDLVPYPTHRNRIGVEMNGDYEDALVRLLAGEGGYLLLDSDHALRELRTELQSRNPNTGVYRDYAAVDVRLNPALVDTDGAISRPAPAGARAQAALASEVARGGGAVPAEVEPSRGPASTAVTGSTSVPGPTAATGSAGSSASGTAGAVTAPAEGCRWCRAPLPSREGLNFCPYCGTDVRSVPCAGCGAEIEPDWRFCIACGTERRS